jgi:hypothetical protein
MSLEITLTEIVARLRQGRFPNEQAIIQGVVLPVLQELNWDTRDAAWLLVQTAVYRNVQSAIQQHARVVLRELLENGAVSSYGRYRLLHHLAKARHTKQGKMFRLIEQLSQEDQQRIEALLPQFLGAPAFELNLIALYLLKVSGRNIDEMRALVSAHCSRGCEPVRNALEAAAQVPETRNLASVSVDEPDAIPVAY